MNTAYPGPQPGVPAPRRPQWTRYLPLAVGVVGFAGLAGTLLPMWSLTLQPRDIGLHSTNVIVDDDAVTVETVGGAALVEVGFYDWFVSAVPMIGFIPIVFALAIAVSATQPLRSDDRRLWAAISAFALCALVVTAMTSIRPQSRQEVTGPLAGELDQRSFASITDPTPMDVGIEAGFALAIAALIAVCGLSCWQYVVTSRGLNP